MTKANGGMIKTVIPIAILAVGGLVGWGGHRQQIKTNASEIEKKVDVTVYGEHKDADKAQHEQIQNSLNTIQADVKELLKK